jgi:sugar phosphate isomerase/epimerase
MSSLNRRRFLGAAIGTGAAAAAAGTWTPGAAAQDGGSAAGGRRSVPNNRIGIQLYTLRHIMVDRPSVRRVLNRLGAMGYTEVEMAGHYDLPAAQLRGLLDDAGLRPVSGHDGFPVETGSAWEAGYRASLEYAAELGQKFTGLAYFEGPYDEARFHALAQQLNRAGALAQEYGLQFFYHNHDFEFENKQATGAPLYDILLAETNRDLVKFQLDLYWILDGGENPLAYLSADPARYMGYHVKDRTWKPRPNDGPNWEDAGPGSIDFPDIFAAGLGRPRTDKHYIVEHDDPRLSHPGDPDAGLKTAQAGVTYLRNVRF